MTAQSDPKSACKTCGAPIPEDAPGALCPACLLRDSRTDPGPAAASVPSLASIADAFPELEVIELIGRGGMGAVYRARQPNLDREIALKILLPDLSADPAFAERFTREARALAKLNHPNIVAVYDFGERDGLFYLAMEFVDGVNLRGAMAAGRFTPEQALAVIPGICDALTAAHGLGILHRDIKPENILLDHDGKVKIVDFGIARIVGDPDTDFTLTEAGAVLGSRQYMAPEQIEGSREVDHRADIYSLGVVFYEMLTGELPIGRFRPPSEKSATSEAIDAVVLRALEKELDRRFQSAGEVKTGVQGASQDRVSPPPRQDKARSGPGSGLGNIARITTWAIALGISATVLVGVGSAAVESRYGWLGILFLTLGTLAGIFGYIASLLGLKAMARQEIPRAGGWLLNFFVIGTPVLATIFAVFILAMEQYFDFFNLLAYPMLLSAAAAFLVASLTARMAGFRIRKPAIRRRVVTVLAVSFAATAAYLYVIDSRWPFNHSLARAKIDFAAPSRGVDDQQLQSAVKIAAGEHYEDYMIEVKDEIVTITVLHEEFMSHEASAHIGAFVQRLFDLLPAEAIFEPDIDTLIRGGKWRERMKRMTPHLLFHIATSGLIAAGFALLGPGSGIPGVAVMLAVIGANILFPLPYSSSNQPRLINTLPLDPLLLPAEAPDPDLGTPEGAARAFNQAALRRDRALLQRTFTKKSWAEISEWPEDRLFRSFRPYRILTIERRKSADPAEDPARMKVVLIGRDGRHVHRKDWLFTLEDGEWRFTNN